jgi:hypothetical protein
VPELSLSLFSFSGKQVTFESFVSLDFSAACYSEAFGGASVGLDLRHY